MTKTVKPVYEGFWYNSNQDILARLDQAARKLKEKRAAQLQDNQEMTQPYLSPQPREELLPLRWAHRTPCPTVLQGNPGGHPEGGHSQHSSWTLDWPSKDCPPISWSWPTNLAAPSPRNSGQLLSEAEFNHQDAHRSSSQGSPDVDCPDHPAQGHAEKDVTRRNPKPHQLSLNRTPVWNTTETYKFAVHY